MPASASIEKLVKQSKFIFVGTVKKLKAATMSTVPVNNGTIIVKVDQVIQVPPGFGDYRGKQITVQLRPREKVKVGQKRIFFTNGVAYGSSLAVVAVGHTPVPKNVATLRKQVAATVQSLADKDLTARIKKAAVVVAGKVSDVRPVPARTEQGPVSFHDPDWHEAVIQIESVEKGKPAQETIVVHFPNSTDRMWRRAPKFRLGQEGVFLLHKGQIKEHFGEAAETLAAAAPQGEIYAALHPLDFQPKEQLEQIKSMIKGK